MMSKSPGENIKERFCYLFEVLPFANLDIETCKTNISNTITARSCNQDHLIQDYLVNDFFSSCCILQIWVLKTCNKSISKTITAMSFKFDDVLRCFIFFILGIENF